MRLTEKLLAFLGRKQQGSAKANSSTIVLSADSVESAIARKLPASLASRYTVERLLGHGAYGVVYLVRDELIGRLVALKVLYQKLLEKQEIYDHFIQEARIAGQFDHKNIVVIYNVEVTDNCACIVMEYLAEGSLSQELENRTEPFSEEEAIEISLGILDALQVTHRIGVTHRDIKPANILFDPKGAAKVSDYGIAHLPSELGGVHSELEYSAVGTPSYMPPEQLRGDRSIDQRADLYAVGAILYEMLSLKLMNKLEENQSLEDLATSLDKNSPVELASHRPDLSRDLCDIVRRLTASDAEERYSSAKEAIVDLRDYLEKNKQEEEREDFVQQTSRVALLEDVLRLLLADGKISTPERKELDKRAARLGVSVSDARLVEKKIRQEMGLAKLESLEVLEATATVFATDGEYSPEELEILKETSSRLGISDKERLSVQDDVLERRQQD